MSDTTPDVAARYRAMLMQRSSEERFMMGIRSFDAARAIVLASLPPGLDDNEVKRLLFARFYPELTREQVPPRLRLP
jgi:hypothetical protein